MKEPKAVHAFDVYEDYTKTSDDEQAQVYLKSEADRCFAWHKYKRCEKILENLSLAYNIECMKKYPTRGFFFEKWSRVFMRLAEHYKEMAK